MPRLVALLIPHPRLQPNDLAVVADELVDLIRRLHAACPTDWHAAHATLAPAPTLKKLHVEMPAPFFPNPYPAVPDSGSTPAPSPRASRAGSSTSTPRDTPRGRGKWADATRKAAAARAELPAVRERLLILCGGRLPASSLARYAYDPSPPNTPAPSARPSRRPGRRPLSAAASSTPARPHLDLTSSGDDDDVVVRALAMPQYSPRDAAQSRA